MVLTPDERHVIVTNTGTLVIIEVGPDGLTDQRAVAVLDRTALETRWRRRRRQWRRCRRAFFHQRGPQCSGLRQGWHASGHHSGSAPSREPDHQPTAAQDALFGHCRGGERRTEGWIDTIPLLTRGPNGRQNRVRLNRGNPVHRAEISRQPGFPATLRIPFGERGPSQFPIPSRQVASFESPTGYCLRCVLKPRALAPPAMTAPSGLRSPGLYPRKTIAVCAARMSDPALTSRHGGDSTGFVRVHHSCPN